MIYRISQIEDDVYAVAASYGPTPKDRVMRHTVRGVPVQTLRINKVENNRHYRLCVFPGHHEQWVNEGNIRGYKVPDTGSITEIKPT